MFVAIIDITYLLQARAIDMQTMRHGKFESGVIHLKPRKTAKSSAAANIVITPTIRGYDRGRAIKRSRGIISPHLFATTKGGAYSKTGLISMWR
ncbi:hypothetical protein IP92_02777 [Pseudoduganella flava]|nr:hypothetical protein IP92_02777 [Pseudoduganella flava]